MKKEKRKLGYWEELCQTGNDNYHGNGLIAAVAKFSHPKLNLNRFHEAVQSLQAQQPLLRARVKKGSLNSQFIIDHAEETYLPYQHLARTRADLWEAVIELELNRPPRNQDYQWRLILLFNETSAEHEVILIAGHNIGDGLSIAYFFDSLFKIYEKLHTDTNFSLYPPVEKLLGHMNNQKTPPPLNFTATSIYYQNVVPLGERVTKNYYHCLSIEATKTLITHCKKKGFSVNAFLNAAILRCLAKILKQNLSTTLHTPINLRKWCQPEIPNNYFGCYVSVVTTYHHDITELSNLDVLASSYERQLKNIRLPGDAIFPQNFHKREIFAGLSLWAGHADQFSMGPTVTNLGLLPFSGQYNLLSWDSCYFCTSRQNADIPVLLNVLTMNTQLMLCFTYTHPMLDKAFMERYIEQFLSCLKV
ncbi:condensation domain-containing protein [Legionella hackeliae]|uniref:Uncharacterized protein n=1 Tax=Legionella hackeliae TaxID=449 RepID=A0A0A8UMX7_LEGHA|nr:condensation domain-containing protein [Legionella hackeliae]KTD10578.1 acyltransferase PapA5 [Legionella hackeliae]CEK10083.1 conserved protein of unknown function [Legionella hackeliae]STX46807.1 Malonyl CoA-acyl carrier protein transacylase [Legionella hackeliae]